MKKIFSAFVVAAFLVTSMSTTVFAHGHNKTGRAEQTTYGLCPIEDCNTTGVHKHNDTAYAGHYYNDGHEHHQVCTVADCRLTVNHDHDGVACLPHRNGDGHGYHNGGNRKHH